MNTRFILIILVALGIFAYIGFNEPAAETGSTASPIELHEPGIQIASSMTAVGQGSSEFRQIISYTVTLQNAETTPVYIQSAEPILISDIKPRAISTNLVQSIEQEVPAGESIEISGEIEFNSEALSKKDIDAMGALLTGFRINSYRVVLIQNN